MEWKDPQSIGCAGFSMTINDQIRETSVRVSVRVLLATSGAAAEIDVCVPTYTCVYMWVYTSEFVYTIKDRAEYIADVGGAP